MTRSSPAMLTLTALLILLISACGGGGGGGNNTGGPAPATFDTPIDDLAITNVTRGSGGFPTQTSSGDEPVIEGVEVFEAPDGSLVMEFIILSRFPVTRLHLDIGGEHFVSATPAAGGPGFSLSACDALASVEGQSAGCSERCWRASSCIRNCSGTFTTLQAQETAALQCSIASNLGFLGNEPGDLATSEEDYIRTFFTHGPDGDTSLTVLSVSGTICDISECPDIAETCWASGYSPSETVCIPAGSTPAERVQVGFAPGHNFDFLPETSPIIVRPQSNPPSGTLTGTQFAPGNLASCSLSSGAGASSPCRQRDR